jgi:hypothetical protein
MRYQEDDVEFSDADRVTVDDWAEPIALLKEDLSKSRSMALGMFIAGISFQIAATPVRERYFPPELIAQLTKERYPKGIRALDIGSSIMVGALQLMHKDEFPMEFDKVSTGAPGSAFSEDLTKEVNEIVARPSVFNEIICVDRFPFYNEIRQRYDAASAEYALSGLRPSERNNPDYFNIVKSLMSKKQKDADGYDSRSRVKFHAIDPLDPVELLEFRDQYPEPFDFVIMNYVTQELPTTSQRRLHSIASELVSEAGIILYNHQAYLHPWNVQQPAPIENLRHYESYATVAYRSHMHIVDKQHPVEGLQDMMRYYDNRCREVKLGVGKLVVNGSAEPIIDLVRHG